MKGVRIDMKLDDRRNAKGTIELAADKWRIAFDGELPQRDLIRAAEIARQFVALLPLYSMKAPVDSSLPRAQPCGCGEAPGSKRVGALGWAARIGRAVRTLLWRIVFDPFGIAS